MNDSELWFTLAIYIAGFRHWVMTEEDRQRLEELVASRREAESTSQES